MTERELFEAWAKQQRMPLDTDEHHGEYKRSYTIDAWIIWQAARAQPAQPQSSTSNQVEVGTTVPAGQVLTQGLRLARDIVAREAALTPDPIDRERVMQCVAKINEAIKHHGIGGEKGGA